MRLAINFFKTALACLALAIAACGGQTSTNSQGLSTADATVASMKAAAQATASPSGTTIPSATQIFDSSGNRWTLSGGLIYENGALAGYSKNVTLLVYDNNKIYEQNSAGGWWTWHVNTWLNSSDPRTAGTSPAGTTIPSASQIVDSSGNRWTLSAGVVYENGALAGYSKGVTELVYDNSKIYEKNSAGGWWSWHGNTWISTSDPLTAPVSGGTLTIGGTPATSDVPGKAYSFVPTTTNTGGGTLTFSITNKPSWASFSTVTGALTGTPSTTQVGTYSNILVDVSNGSASAAHAAFAITVAAGSASLSWTAPTENTNGSPLKDLAGYTIYYGTSAGELTQTIQVANASATSYVVGNLSAGTYYFAISSYTTVGTQSVKSAVGSTTIL